jgi:ribosomal protein L37E
VNQHESLTCERCGHDVFVEITSTESRVYGKFELREDAIVLLEQHEGVPELDRRETALILRCDRCGKPAYEWLSPIGDDAPGYRRKDRALDTSAHARTRDAMMEDPEYREAYERSMREIREQQERGE